ncbi:MAG TPA: winged helix-turn-helix domain-containing protein [Thermoleophilaceae bacterium]|nr:winged helix-turn-helix domain-containing protein [Thermoleophilaceae bacterium]
MTVPIDITDPKLVKAYAHPLRIRILSVLDNRVASPSEIAEELGTPLSNTSYHVRQLASLGLVELVNRTARRGAIEHYYTASVRPTITDEGWAKLPQIVKRAHFGGILQTAIAHIVSAAEVGGFDRDDIHYSRTTGRLDKDAWAEVADALARVLGHIERILEESEARISGDSSLPWQEATVLMTLFAGPSTKTLQPPGSATEPVPESADTLDGVPDF